MMHTFGFNCEHTTSLVDKRQTNASVQLKTVPIEIIGMEVVAAATAYRQQPENTVTLSCAVGTTATETYKLKNGREYIASRRRLCVCMTLRNTTCHIFGVIGEDQGFPNTMIQARIKNWARVWQ